MGLIKKLIILMGALGFGLWTPANKEYKEVKPQKNTHTIETTSSKERPHSRKW